MQVPAPFEYERATSVDHAIALMERLGSEARIVAGGHSLLPMMKLRLATPEYLIDINDLSPELEYIRIDGGRDGGAEGGMVRIGALTRHRHLLESEELAAVLPIFRDAERVIADPVVRNRGTLGGSLCQADPAEDLSAVCDTVEAQCVIRGSAGERVVAMHDFHQGPFETAVGDGEMLTEVRIPLKPNSSSAYHKVERRAGDWAVASAGAAVTMDGDTIADGRVGLCAVGPNLTNVEPISAALRGQPPSEELYAEVGQIAADNASPVADTRGTVAYKTHLAKELTVRSLRTAVARATGQA
jgi:carbon-monoxide dehydrogenase medium subunit